MRVQLALQHGDLIRAQQYAERNYQRFRSSSPEWAWKFRILEAESLLLRGMSQEALDLLSGLSAPPTDRTSVIQKLTVEGVAYARLHSFSAAEDSLARAERLCAAGEDLICGNVIRARGVLAVERGQLPQAGKFFGQSLSFARAHRDQFLEATALLNLGLVAADQEHFDEAKDESNAAYQAAAVLHAERLALVAQGNAGWASYRLGDSEKALAQFQNAEKRAAQLGVEDVFDRENELTNIGYIYMDAHKFDLAARSFQRALDLAEGIKSKEDIYNALRVLARLALLTDDTERASRYADRALGIAHESGNHVDELYPMLVQGEVAARHGDATDAENRFHEIEQDKSCPVFLKWESEHALAQLYESENHSDAADRDYRRALATFEVARNAVKHEDSQLSFLTNASHIYDDYLHFLIARGKSNEALRWADYSRARTLGEGLGLLPKGTSSGPPPLHPQEIARRMKSTILFYWLGEKQSYLWTITPRQISLIPLPAASEIDAAVERYRGALGGPQDVLDVANDDGRSLYRMLVAPVGALLPRESKVVIIPDGTLNNLNFETLLVSEPRLHYWIEDVTLANSSSLRLLAASHASNGKHARNLLLLGDSVAPSKDYPELPKAGIEMENVAKHFPASQRRVLQRSQATPAAFLASNPEQFSMLRRGHPLVLG